MPEGPSIWLDTRIYLAVVAGLLFVILCYNWYAAILGFVLLSILYLYGRERHTAQQKAMQFYLKNVAQNVNMLSNYALQQLPVAIVLLDESGSIQWSNNLFVEWMGEIRPGDRMEAHWPGLPLEGIYGQSGKAVYGRDGRFFEVVYRPVKPGDMMVLYILDVTDSEQCKLKQREDMPVLAYIQFDNYDDVLQGLTDARRTAILASINQLLDDWVLDVGGFLKRVAEDTHFAVLNRKALDKIMSDKFDILDKVRSLRGSHKFPATLSMGAATGPFSLAELGEIAQAGLDLALGRGGDQVAVQIGKKVQFFGGKVQAVEKHTRVKARVVSHALYEIIENADLVLVMGHHNEDFDSLGASLGVARMAKHLQKQTYIVVSDASAAVRKLGVLLKEYVEYEHIFITGDEALLLKANNPVLFVVDMHIPDIAAAPQLLAKYDRVIVVDHHRRSENFIKNPLLIYLEPSSSSTSELVTELLMYYSEEIGLTRMDATALYAGMVLDTKNFTVQTGVRTFDAAAYLRRAGADPRLIRNLFKLDYDGARARAVAMASAKMLPGGVVVGRCGEDVQNAQVIAAQVADWMLTIEEVRVSLILFRTEDGSGVCARSNGDVNVQVLMEQLGGGGHQTVAGTQLKNMMMDELETKLIALCDEYIKESET